MGPPIQISQNPDIRYLGRILGDVIRAYGGEKLFRQTEYIRSASVDRHRGIAGAEASDPGLEALSLDDTVAFLRGFMAFSGSEGRRLGKEWWRQVEFGGVRDS